MHRIMTMALAGALLAAPALAQDGGLISLRGATPIPDTNDAPVLFEQSKPANGFGRAYRQQPPLVPHRIEGYQVTKGFNKCLSCHGWPQNAKAGAPKVSETHYVDRAGARTDQITGGRWFCTQCHVPQVDAQALVPNAFKNARDVGGAFD